MQIMKNCFKRCHVFKTMTVDCTKPAEHLRYLHLSSAVLTYDTDNGLSNERKRWHRKKKKDEQPQRMEETGYMEKGNFESEDKTHTGIKEKEKKGGRRWDRKKKKIRDPPESEENIYRQMLKARVSQAKCTMLLKLQKSSLLPEVQRRLNQEYNTVTDIITLQNSSAGAIYLVEMKKKVTGSQIISVKSNHTERLTMPDTKLSICWDEVEKCDTMSAQIKCVYEQLKLTDQEIRTRFFVFSLISKALNKVEDSNIYLLPFGSVSCNLALKGSSDLDLTVLRRDQSEKQNITNLAMVYKILQTENTFSNVLFIKHARVPIIKLKERNTLTNIDISWGRMDGLVFSEMFYLINWCESNFYPLVLVLKYWVKVNNLSPSLRGSSISSFMITILVIAYLQQQGFVPPLKQFFKRDVNLKGQKWSLEDWEMMGLIERGASIRSIYSDQNTCEELLIGFLKFYANFPFDEKIIDVQNGQLLSDNHGMVMYVLNPLEDCHNICRNITQPHLERFTSRCNLAYRSLEVMKNSNELATKGLKWLFLEDNSEDMGDIPKRMIDIQRLYSYVGDDFDPVSNKEEMEHVAGDEIPMNIDKIIQSVTKKENGIKDKFGIKRRKR